VQAAALKTHEDMTFSDPGSLPLDGCEQFVQAAEFHRAIIQNWGMNYKYDERLFFLDKLPRKR
jgi:hypothetical protein